MTLLPPKFPSSKLTNRLAVTIITFLLLIIIVGHRGSAFLPIACSSTSAVSPPVLPVPPAGAKTYSTQFTTDENPISEGGSWTNGKAIGLDWSDVAVSSGLAYGIESGSGGYDDSTAILTGTWAPNQMTQATVRSVNQNDGIYEEVELRLRSSLTAHRSTGYEINFRCSKTVNTYTQIVRWNGPLGDFTYLNAGGGSNFGVANGDIVKATAIGNVITVYVNGVQVLQATDSTYGTGNPGMGFFLQGGSGVNKDYGFTKFNAAEL